MKPPARFDDKPLTAVWGSRAPDALSREGRVRLIGEAAEILIKTGTEAGLFAGGALLAWLQKAGSLERDYFKVTKPKSHITPSVIWRQINAPHRDEGRDAEEREK